VPFPKLHSVQPQLHLQTLQQHNKLTSSSSRAHLRNAGSALFGVENTPYRSLVSGDHTMHEFIFRLSDVDMCRVNSLVLGCAALVAWIIVPHLCVLRVKATSRDSGTRLSGSISAHTVRTIRPIRSKYNYKRHKSSRIDKVAHVRIVLRSFLAFIPPHNAS